MFGAVYQCQFPRIRVANSDGIRIMLGQFTGLIRLKPRTLYSDFWDILINCALSKLNQQCDNLKEEMMGQENRKLRGKG